MIKKLKEPILTKYIYRKFRFNKSCEPVLDDAVKIECEIIAESETQYKIKIKESNLYFVVGREMWVKKKNIEYHKEKYAEKKEYDYTNAPWNN